MEPIRRQGGDKGTNNNLDEIINDQIKNLSRDERDTQEDNA
jgi:hypothetical protein